MIRLFVVDENELAAASAVLKGLKFVIVNIPSSVKNYYRTPYVREVVTGAWYGIDGIKDFVYRKNRERRLGDCSMCTTYVDERNVVCDKVLVGDLEPNDCVVCDDRSLRRIVQKIHDCALTVDIMTGDASYLPLGELVQPVDICISVREHDGCET